MRETTSRNERPPKQGGQTGNKGFGECHTIIVRQPQKHTFRGNLGSAKCCYLFLIRVTPPIFAPIPLGSHAHLLNDGIIRFNEVLNAEHRTIWTRTPRSYWHPILPETACSNPSLPIHKLQLDWSNLGPTSNSNTSDRQHQPPPLKVKHTTKLPQQLLYNSPPPALLQIRPALPLSFVNYEGVVSPRGIPLNWAWGRPCLTQNWRWSEGRALKLRLDQDSWGEGPPE